MIKKLPNYSSEDSGVPFVLQVIMDKLNEVIKELNKKSTKDSK